MNHPLRNYIYYIDVRDSMPKGHGGRRRGFVALPYNAVLALSTLGDGIVLTVTPIVTTEDLFVISVDCNWSIRSQTPGEGPLSVGVAHADLTVGEIAEALDASMVNPDDIIARERSRRPVRRAGVFPGLLAEEVIADGRAVRTRCKFSVGQNGLAHYVQNRSGGALSGGAVLVCDGTIYGRWQR